MSVATPVVGVDVPDVVAQAVARLTHQFQNKPRIQAHLEALVGPFQTLQGVLWQLITQRTLANAQGVLLDTLGKIVGQERGGLDDATYKQYIAAKILTNRSKGTTEDLIKVATAILADDTYQITVTNENFATVEISLTEAVTSDALADTVITFLRRAVSAGVRAILVSMPEAAATAFMTEICDFVAVAVAVGDTAIVFSGAAGGFPAWPSSGSIVIGTGGGAETLPFHIVGTSFILDSAATKVHAIGVQATLVSAVGEGWGDSGDVNQPTLVAYGTTGATGGAMSDARE